MNERTKEQEKYPYSQRKNGFTQHYRKRAGFIQPFKKRAGFTLIEMIVALGVFSILMGSISAIFIMASKVQRRTAIAQRVLNDARYIMESIASDMRVGRPNFDAYSPPLANTTPPVNKLLLIDEDGVSISYFLASSGCPTGSYLCLMRDGISQTSQRVNVDDIEFYISPVNNPFPVGTKQPRVTISLTFSSAESGSDRSVITLQTTASSRYYGP